nr:MetaGeneMark_Unknown Function [uncultured bacterium]
MIPLHRVGPYRYDDQPFGGGYTSAAFHGRAPNKTPVVVKKSKQTQSPKETKDLTARLSREMALL